MKKYELLAPAGNFAMLVTAINAGADAVYFGLNTFTMRTTAKNFSIKDLDKVAKICKTKGVKRYLTLNAIIYDDELKDLEKTIKKVKGKIDAIICWDLAVINLCRKYEIPFFVSTQGSVANSKSAEIYKKLGAKRIILARELNLKQIKKISKIIDIECFAHGAMCVSVSGRCFTSQFLFNKSANRGKCAQPCRRSYIVKEKVSEQVQDSSASEYMNQTKEGYELEIENNKIFSAKDLCTLPFIEQMKKAGIMGFKIEGRGRDPRYVDTVIRIYRKALDNKLSQKEIKDLIQELKKVYNREFSSGFYFGVPTSDDLTKIEHSSATEKKHFIGKVIKYYPKINVATFKLVSPLKVGNKIIVIGDKTGLIKSTIKNIEIKKQSKSSAKKGQEIAIKLPLVKKNDDIYLIK